MSIGTEVVPEAQQAVNCPTTVLVVLDADEIAGITAVFPEMNTALLYLPAGGVGRPDSVIVPVPGVVTEVV